MQIDVWSDLVCPWCYLGYARLEKALASFAHRDETRVVLRAFELDPRAPRDLDVPTDEALEKKFGIGRAQVDAMHERMRALGRADGIDFRFERVRTSNTFDAHQVVLVARAHGMQAPMVERLFRANFHEGVRIGDRKELARLASEVGVGAGAVEEALVDGRCASAVRDDEAAARELGVSGVPFFLAGGEVAVSGAQSVEVLGRMLEAGWAKRADPSPEGAGPPARRY